MAYYCVDYLNGSDATGDGTALAPWATVQYAETQINGGSGFIVGDEIRIASSTLTEVGTGYRAGGTNGNITTSSDLSGDLAAGDLIALSSTLVGQQPWIYRVISITSSTISVVYDSSYAPMGQPSGVSNTLTIYKVDNLVQALATGYGTVKETIAATNYGFTPNSNSVIISGGWDPSNFTSLTSFGYTGCSLDPASTYQQNSYYTYARIWSMAYANGFIFKNFTSTQCQFVYVSQSNQVFNADNIAFRDYNVSCLYNRTSSTISAYYSDFITCATNQTSSYSYIDDIKLYGVADSNAVSNYIGYTLGSFVGASNVECILAENNNRMIISRVYAKVPDVTLTQLDSSKFKFQGYNASYFGTNISQVNFEIPTAWAGVVDSLFGEDTSYSPGHATYNGDLWADFDTVFSLSGYYNPSTTTYQFGTNPNNSRITDINGTYYLAGFSSYVFNTTDQDTGSNCIELRPWSNNGIGRYHLGIDAINVEPGQTIDFSAKVKSKDGATGNAFITIMNNNTNGQYLETGANGRMYAAQGWVQESSPTAITDTEWTTINLQVTIPDYVYGSVLLAVTKYGNSGNQKMLIDSYTYSIS